MEAIREVVDPRVRQGVYESKEPACILLPTYGNSSSEGNFGCAEIQENLQMLECVPELLEQSTAETVQAKVHTESSNRNFSIHSADTVVS